MKGYIINLESQDYSSTYSRSPKTDTLKSGQPLTTDKPRGTE